MPYSRASSLLLLVSGLMLVSLGGPLAGQEPAKTIRRGGASGARRALVIGNGAYKESPLRCPVNDASDMATALKGLGFAVTSKTNATYREMEDAIRAFGAEVQPNDVALFYFSGHGAQVGGVNYLIPVGMDAQSEEEIKYKAAPADLVLDKLKRAKSSVNIVILDACRNNPFQQFKGLQQGLAPMTAVKGSLIAYATAPGTVALDGSGRNSPYTKHLLRNIKTPGLEVGRALRQVRAAVLAETKQKQVPWEAVSLVGDFYFAGRIVPSMPDAPMEDLRVTATFTVREEKSEGPLVEGAEVELWYQPRTGLRGTLMGSANSDEKGRANVDATLSLDQQLRGAYVAVVNRGTLTKSWSLPRFPERRVWNVYAPKLPMAPTIPSRPPTTTPTIPSGSKTITNSIGMKLVLIPAGEFIMGSPESDADAFENEHPQHRVKITKPFYLGVTEVTQEQYERVMGENPSQFKDDPQRPVETVSWEDADKFCERLSEKEGKMYHLPTEAEWEYACRAGSTTKWCFGDSESQLGDYAWYDEEYGSGSTHPVGQKKPNAWGLYDMHGNVWEWCVDWKADYVNSSSSDPTGPSSGSSRVFRGGSWYYTARNCRSAYRHFSPGSERYFLGFRVSLVLADGSGK